MDPPCFRALVLSLFFPIKTLSWLHLSATAFNDHLIQKKQPQFLKNTSFKNKLFTNHIHARTSENTPQYLLILVQVFYQVSISQKLRIFFFNNVPSCNIYDFTKFISSKITYIIPTIQHTIYMYILCSSCSFPVNFLLCTNIPNFNVYNFPVILQIAVPSRKDMVK